MVIPDGKVILIYEDEMGNEFTKEIDISTTINKPIVSTSADNNNEEQETAGQWWISILIGAVIIAGLVAYIIIKKRKGRFHEDI